MGANCKGWLSSYKVLEEHSMCGSRLSFAPVCSSWIVRMRINITIDRVQRLLQATGQLISEGTNSRARFSVDKSKDMPFNLNNLRYY